VPSLSSSESEARAASEVELSRIARRLTADARRTIGVLPVTSAGDVHELVCSMGRSLVDLTASTVSVIDIGGKWPIWARGDAAATKEIWVGRWLDSGRIAALRPARPPVAGEGIAVLTALLEYATTRCKHAVVDLSGLRATGEHLGAFTLVDGVCLVARAGKTRERELTSLCQELPPERNLGVVLVGA
jgi:hypothetical protein